MNSEGLQSLPQKPPGWHTRQTLAVLGFLAFSISYSMRFNLSIAIVAMVNRTHISNMQHNTQDKSFNTSSYLENDNIPCKELVWKSNTAVLIRNSTGAVSNISHSLEEDLLGEQYHWTEAEQGLILGSFFWGYVISQIPGGIIAQKFGGKWPLGIGMLWTAILALLTPWAARNKYWLMLLRVGQGLGEGVSVPSMHVLLSKWTPPEERSKMCAIFYSGMPFGTAVTMILSGYLIHYLGWPSVFYTVGSLSIIWFIFWSLLVFDSPDNHPRIKPQELDYIKHAIGNQTSQKSMRVPWKKVLTSLPVWAVVVAQVGNGWGLNMMHTQIPTYFSTVLHFDIRSNSWLSALPQVLCWLFSIAITHLSDFLIQRNIASILFTRKFCNTVGHWGPALALMGTAFSGCNRILTVILLTLAQGLLGSTFGGFLINSVDIAPNFAGIIVGTANALSNLCGFAAPYVTGIIINGNPSLDRWKWVFLISALIFFVDNLFYVLYTSTDEQPFNREPEKRNKKNDEAYGDTKRNDDHTCDIHRR